MDKEADDDGSDAASGTDDSDDIGFLQLAWETLEVARAVCDRCVFTSTFDSLNQEIWV